MKDETPDNVIEVDFGAKREPPEVKASSDVPTAENAEQKLEAFSRLVDGGTVMITLDARRPQVSVPAKYETDAQLNLNFCHEFGIPDFSYDEEGVRASLSFGGRDVWCDVPWDAVYMMRGHESGDVLIFPSSLPEEIRALLPQIQELAEVDLESDPESE